MSYTFNKMVKTWSNNGVRLVAVGSLMLTISFMMSLIYPHLVQVFAITLGHIMILWGYGVGTKLEKITEYA